MTRVPRGRGTVPLAGAGHLLSGEVSGATPALGALLLHVQEDADPQQGLRTGTERLHRAKHDGSADTTHQVQPMLHHVSDPSQRWGNKLVLN